MYEYFYRKYKYYIYESVGRYQFKRRKNDWIYIDSYLACVVVGVVGATGFFNYDVEWVRVCGVSCVAVDCTHPPSARRPRIRTN